MPAVAISLPMPFRRLCVCITGLWALGLMGMGCSEANSEPPDASMASHLEVFGFVGVACGEDYSAEVASFSNVATTCAPEPEYASLVRDQLDRFSDRSLRALLNVEGLLFDLEEAGALAPTGGPPLRLRTDAQARWNTFLRDAAPQPDELAAVFVADEPTWRGVPTADLERALQIVETSLPTVPLLLVEAYPVLDQLEVPRLVDWVAFDRYGVLDPNADAAYLNDLAILKAKRTRADQRVLLIMETQWLPDYENYGVLPEDMEGVAESYARLARRDTSILGVVGYLWAGGLDGPGQRGARELPATVQDQYRAFGRSIIAPDSK